MALLNSSIVGEQSSRRWSRRKFLTISGALCSIGCGNAQGKIGRVDLVWGKRGLMPGDFTKPRAVAIDEDNLLYIVDMRALIQVFDADGKYLRQWETPTHANGRPSGLAFDRKSRLLVADSHYHRILVYDKLGNLLDTLGGDEGSGPLVGEFGYIGDIAVDSTGAIYVAEAQVKERVVKISPSGLLLQQWGTRGAEPGQFQKIRSLCFDNRDRLFVADACNHRIQVFDVEGKVLQVIGKPGRGIGELDYPYDVAVSGEGNVYVCEYGNCRVQKFASDGRSLGVWGSAGRSVGQLWNPWALGIDRRGRIHVIDSNCNRVQRIIV